MQTLAFHTVDVFTTQPFSGNSLAIVLSADGLSDQQMQAMAREFNLPETLFIQTPQDAANTAKVRIFTPADEIPFAGHPTIGCAIFLAEQQVTDAAEFNIEIRLEEVAGLVPVQVERRHGKINAQLSAPVIPTPVDALDADGLRLDTQTAAQALALSEADISTGQSKPMAHAGGPTFLFIPVNNLEAVSKSRAQEPQSTQLSHCYGATGIYVYYLNIENNEIDARMFAPVAGIPEDPATGSATALLASQLHVAKQLKQGSNRFTLRQGYDMGRPSDLLLDIELVGDELQAVKVAGSSTPISSGQIRIPMTN